MNPKSNLTILTLNSPNIIDFAKARNDLLATAQTEWVMFLDSDEIVTPALEDEIQKAVSRKPYAFDAYLIPRRDVFMGKELKHGETGNAKFVRLAKKNFGQWIRPVHEMWEPVGARHASTAKIGKLHNPIIHISHPTLSTFVDKINKYSTLDAEYRYNLGITASLFQVFYYPLAKFKLNYIFRLGMLDGVPGLINAIMMSWHSYLTWGKLYLLCHKK